LIADAENALSVGDDNNIDIGIWMVAQERGNGMTQRIGNEEAARTAIDVAEFLAAESDDWSVDDGQHLIDVVEEQAVEENFIGVLKLAKIDVALEVVGLERKGLVGANALIVERFDDGREKAIQAEEIALGFGEGSAFIERGIVEKIHSAKMDSSDRVLLAGFDQGHYASIVSLCRDESGQRL